MGKGGEIEEKRKKADIRNLRTEGPTGKRGQLNWNCNQQKATHHAKAKHAGAGHQKKIKRSQARTPTTPTGRHHDAQRVRRRMAKANCPGS